MKEMLSSIKLYSSIVPLSYGRIYLDSSKRAQSTTDGISTPAPIVAGALMGKFSARTVDIRSSSRSIKANNQVQVDFVL